MEVEIFAASHSHYLYPAVVVARACACPCFCVMPVPAPLCERATVTETLTETATATMPVPSMEAWRKPDPKDRNRGEESGSEAVDEARSIMIQPTRRPHPMPGLHQMFGSRRPDTQEFPSMAFMVHGGYSTVVLFDGEERKLPRRPLAP